MCGRHLKKQSGFNLIEVAVVFVIISLVLVATVAPVSNQIERSRIQQTNDLLDDVREALYGFASTFARMPCPATADSNGLEATTGTPDNICSGFHGFVPGNTLGLSGEYNADGLLLDAWGNPIRYSVAQNDSDDGGLLPDFTSIDNAAIPAVTDMQNISRTPGAGISTLVPDLIVCNLPNTPPPTTCTGAGVQSVSSNVLAVVLSLGKDGVNAVQGGAAMGAHQEANSGEALSNAGGVTGTVYRLPGDQAFVSRVYSQQAGNPFDDQIIWLSPNVIIARMIAAGQLP